jgi:hypothetical protein
MAEHPAMAATMVVKEGMFAEWNGKKVTDFELVELVVMKRRVEMKEEKRTELLRK